MLASYNLLKKYVDLDGITYQEVADRLTFAGLEVEGISFLAEATNLVIGEIVECENHPDSDHLHILKVNEGDKYGINQIVCGAPNARVGLKVIVARPGARLVKHDITITPSKIRGVESNGMCCALFELGVDKLFLNEKQINGIEELPEDAPIGEENVLGYLGLDDIVFDINVLPNRSDALALYSLAREVGALFKRKVNIPEPKKYDEVPTNFTTSSDTPCCPQFSIKVVRDVVTKPSPLWLQRALMAQGIRSINNNVDIGNYVMVLTGQPLHMYDLDKLKGTDFSVSEEYEGTLVALDEKGYEIGKGDLVVTNHKEPVCIAGTMGLLSVAVDENTKNIGIESANFKSASIRRTNKKLGLSSESSAHFQKGINPYQDEFVLDLTAQLLVELADAKIIEKTSRYSTLGVNDTKIDCSVSYINKRLGVDFNANKVIDVLKTLNIRIEDFDEDNFVAFPPDYRIDLKCDADLSEEVIRYVGFKEIVSKLPFMPTTTGGFTPNQQKRLDIREMLVNNGLNEILTFNLVAPNFDHDFALLNANDEPYVIMNPMTVDHSVVRRSIVPSVLDTIKYNLDHQQKDLAFFEVATINTKNSDFEELCIALNGNKHIRGELEKRPFDFYDIHGYLESILSMLGIDKNRYKETRLKDSKFYHPGRTVQITIGKDVVGVCGQIHPNYAKDLGPTFVLDLNLTKIFDVKVSTLKMAQFSKYPSVNRDYAFIVNKNVLVGDMIKTIKKNAHSIIKNVDVFDVYIKSNEDEKISIALSITYQDDNKTLTDSQINEVENAVLQALLKEYGAILRG